MQSKSTKSTIIRSFIREVFQSHTFEPVVGDVVSNVNPGCKHYQSAGKIIQVHDLPHDAGKAASYECMNDGSTWDIGDVLTKTLDQLAPVEEKSPLEEKSKNMKRTHKLLREYIRGIISEAPASVADAAGSDDGIPKGEWVLLSPGDERMQAAAEDLFGMVQDTYAGIGGHVKITSPKSLERYQYWVVQDIDEDPYIDVAIFGKPEMGAKMGGAANDGSSAAASAYKTKSAELRSGGSVGGVGNWWGEVSGKPAYAMLKRGATAIEDPEKVAQLLAGDDYEFHGEHPDPNAPALFKSVKGWYTKNFGSSAHTKIILGNPQ